MISSGSKVLIEGSYKRGNVPSVSMKSGDYQRLKESGVRSIRISVKRVII